MSSKCSVCEEFFPWVDVVEVCPSCFDALRAENARLKAVNAAQGELVEALEDIEIDTLIALKEQASSPICMPTVLAAEQIELCRRMYAARSNLAALEEQCPAQS